MISLVINEIPTLFIQAFSREDVECILEFVRDANANSTTFKSTVLFIDTPASEYLVEAIKHLKTEDFKVVFRDHHGVRGNPDNVRDEKKQKAAEKLMEVLKDDCLVTYRDVHPACSTLVEVGEFKNALAIIADPDADGLTSAMKAAGVFYEGMDEDAALLDSEPKLQVTGTEISQLLAKGIATLPSYDPENPNQRERTLEELFANWVKAVSGDKNAREILESGVKNYELAVDCATLLAAKAKEVAPGVVLVDVTDSPVFDVGTISRLVEENPRSKILVLKKDKGPIAARHSVQYSLSVNAPFKEEIDLRKYVPPQTVNDPASGVISNVSFLLHVSEEIWKDYVLPRLVSSMVQ